MHLSADLLSLLALGEDVASPEEHHHLAGCGPCSEELTALSEVVTLGRSLTDADVLLGPGPEVWQRIQVQTRARPPADGLLPASAPPAAVGPRADPDPSPQPTEPGTGRPAEDATEADGGVAPVRIPAPPTRPRRRAVTALVAVIALVAGVAIGLGVNRLAQPTLELVAEIGLSPVSEAWPTASGTARLQRTSDGRRELTVDLDPGRPVPGWGEVWLVNEDFERMVSLGTLDAEQASYVLPADLDVADFPWVDVSAELDDGDSAHSGDSIARGELPR